MHKLELTKQQEERAEELFQTATIMDMMSGYVVHPEPHLQDGKSYLERLIASNYRIVNMTISAHADDFETVLDHMFHYFNLFQVASDRIIHVKRVSDIERAIREKKVGVMFGFQTPTPINEHFYRWTIFQQLGLRTCELTYMEHNIFGDGCWEPADNGLTYYGIQAVQEMNRLGIVVDCSHAGERTALEAIEKSVKPCIYSHSNAKAVTPSKRNASDEAIKLLAKKGGVMGLTPHALMTYKQVGERPTLNDYLDHFEYLAKLVGVDHVGVGSDMYESYTKFSWEMSSRLFYNLPWVYETVFNEGWTRIEHIKDVIRGLIARGFTDADCRKILGDNFLRIFGAVWREDF